MEFKNRHTGHVPKGVRSDKKSIKFLTSKVYFPLLNKPDSTVNLQGCPM